jgi:hypothetical protein
LYRRFSDFFAPPSRLFDPYGSFLTGNGVFSSAAIVCGFAPSNFAAPGRFLSTYRHFSAPTVRTAFLTALGGSGVPAGADAVNWMM